MLFKSPDEDGDENDSSGNTFVTTCMLLVINMIANDLNLPVEYYLSKTVPSQYVDIYVNFNDEDKVYEESSVELIWPHYQNRYCIIYSNTIKNLPSEILREFSVQNMSSHISWFIGFILYLTVFRFKYEMALPFGDILCFWIFDTHLNGFLTISANTSIFMDGLFHTQFKVKC